MASLLYGSGLHLLECCRLRVQDVDFATNQIVVRGAEGDNDRVTMLPAVIKADLAGHLERVREQHQADLQAGAGWIEPPTALARKDLNAARGSSQRHACTATASPESAAHSPHAPPLLRDPPARR